MTTDRDGMASRQRDACPLCGEPIAAADDVRPLGREAAHRECLLRAVLGGIGHHEDHAYWCTVRGDPDGGRTYRQSALEVERLTFEELAT